MGGLPDAGRQDLLFAEHFGTVKLGNRCPAQSANLFGDLQRAGFEPRGSRCRPNADHAGRPDAGADRRGPAAGLREALRVQAHRPARSSSLPSTTLPMSSTAGVRSSCAPGSRRPARSRSCGTCTASAPTRRAAFSYCTPPPRSTRRRGRSAGSIRCGRGAGDRGSGIAFSPSSSAMFSAIILRTSSK